jgi:hypothetical protein
VVFLNTPLEIEKTVHFPISFAAQKVEQASFSALHKFSMNPEYSNSVMSVYTTIKCSVPFSSYKSIIKKNIYTLSWTDSSVTNSIRIIGYEICKLTANILKNSV